MFLRRLGQNNGQLCVHGHQCSQVLEMTDGDFAVVGTEITADAIKAMPPGPGVGEHEVVAKVPRAVMFAAVKDLLTTASV